MVTVPACGVDLEAVGKTYDLLLAHEPLTNALTRAVQRLASDLAFAAMRVRPREEELRQFLILFECPLLFDPEQRSSLILPLFKAVNSLTADTKRLLSAVLAGYTADRLLRLVQIFQQFITIQLMDTSVTRWLEQTAEAVVALGLVYDASTFEGRVPPLVRPPPLSSEVTYPGIMFILLFY